MANNRIYANFLMHGRTKGSRNGISTTKGYTAVGKKATGKLINGRYVYDQPYGYTPSSITTGYTPLSAISEKERIRQQEAEEKKAQQAYDSAAKGAANNWQQQAALAQLRKQNQNNVAAKKKAQQAYDSAAKGAANNWQQQAAAARDNKETYTKYKEGKINAITGKVNSGDVVTMYHPKDPYGVDYTAIKTEKLGAASKGKKNNWQQAGNLTRSMTEVSRDLHNRYMLAKAKEAASVEKMKSKQPNAMKGDPRYSKDSSDRMLFEEARFLGRPITGSGNNGEAVNAKDFYDNKKGNAPYSNQLDKASNKQEYTAAIAKQKAFDNAYKESRARNSRSDIGNAVADFKEEAKAKAKSLFKKKKKKK